jgi:hypothetical protein
MSEVFTEVIEDDVTKLFQSIPFRVSLRQASGFTKRTGYESGFRVVRDLYSGTYYVSRVVEGVTDGFNFEDEVFDTKFDNFEFEGQNIPFDRCYQFLRLHFHPESTKYPIPSYDDLLTSEADIENWKTQERIEVRPIIAISHILNDDTVISLLYQKKCSTKIGQLQALKELDSDLNNIVIANPSEAVGYLEESGLFHADIITLEKRRHYSPNKKDYAKLTLFAHTPVKQTIADDSIPQPIQMELYSDQT